MKTLNITLAAFAVASTLATSAFAHSEFRDRDSIQGATASFGQSNTAQANVSPVAFNPTFGLSDAERVTVLKNELKDYNK